MDFDQILHKCFESNIKKEFINKCKKLIDIDKYKLIHYLIDDIKIKKYKFIKESKDNVSFIFDLNNLTDKEITELLN